VTTPDEGGRQTDGLRGVRRFAVPAFNRLPAPTRRSVLHALGRYAPWEDGFDPTPPPARANEVTGAPDFVGIGVQKAGTTWWYDLICAHPRVYSRPDIHKERHYFGRYANRPFGAEERAEYLDWFPRPPGRLAGEWTPDYIHLPWTPPLLAQAAPQTRLLVLVRDPVERFRAGLAHQQRERGRRTSVEDYNDAVTRGFYDAALCRWGMHFGPEQILVLQYERCVDDPRRELARTYRFLELDPFVPDGIRSRVNATTKPLDLEEDVRRRLVELYAPDALALSSHFPDIQLDRWPNFAPTVTQ
jgi:Sulfotransferase family